MTSSSSKEDIESFIDAVLQWSIPTVLDTSPSPMLCKTQEPVLPTASPPESSITLSEDQNKILLPALNADNPIQGKGVIKAKPKDYLKNMYNNSLKYIVKRYISKNYEKRVEKIHRKVGITDSEAAKSYYRIRQEETIGLTNLCDLLNYASGSEIQKKYKRAFRIFYAWFIRSKYPVHILQTDKLQHSDVYWRAKNVLIYLPEVKIKEKPTTKKTPKGFIEVERCRQ